MALAPRLHSSAGKRRLRRAWATCRNGAMAAAAAGSSRQVGARTPNTISAAARKPPRQTACRAAVRSPASSRAGGRPRAAP
eukprot:14976494-Alexandrium_andersonii.AAC.1